MATMQIESNQTDPLPHQQGGVIVDPETGAPMNEEDYEYCYYNRPVIPPTPIRDNGGVIVIDDVDQRQHRQVFGWYPNEEIVVDNFTYDQVGAAYNAVPCLTVGEHLMERAMDENVKYMTICIPNYNEDKEELYKTMLSLMKSADFMRKARLKDNDAGLAVEHEFQTTIYVLVPIFDGVRAMAENTKDWLKVNFEGTFDSVLDADTKKPDEDDEVVVITACRRWWYYARDIVPPANGKDFIGDKETFEDHLIPFYLCPIVKKNNHRKHNSHQWFFDSVCLALGNSVNFAFLTDCGTTFEPSCPAILFKELCLNPELIGVTARQRVEWPNKYFHPCQDAPFAFLEGNHDDEKTKKPCWKCYTVFLLGPGPLQGFEFEATLVTNLSIFNLVEALPVMPGPCQLMNWQKMRHFQVVKEYFSLLFKGEINKKEVLELPEHYHKMVDDISEVGSNDGSGSYDDSDHEDEMMPVPIPVSYAPMYDELGHLIHGQVMGLNEAGDALVDVHNKPIPFDATSKNVIGEVDMPLIVPKGRKRKHHHKHDDMHKEDTNNKSRASLNFTEFLRTNMRLAEDRVLSFVAVFSTRYGTMWIPGATFYYTPEVKWQTLLLQRRRWINGTFASFLFFLKSKRAKTRLNSRMFDDYSSAKALVLFLWRLQFFQMILVFMSPAIFASAGYISVVDCAVRYPEYWSWGNDYFGNTYFRGVDVWMAICFIIYVGWSFWSHFAAGGRMPEVVCHLLAMLGLVFMVPVYWSLWGFVAANGVGYISAIVIFGLMAPAVISIAESWECVFLYIAYLPWFLALIVFMLIFIPGYSFARLFDTTWGNRATGTDSAIKASEETTMKRWNLVFVIFLIVSNFAGTAFLIRAYTSGYNVVLAVMVFVFVPALIQLFGAVAFWIKTAIYRDMSPSAEQFKHNILPNPSRIADLKRARQEQETGVALLTQEDAEENVDAIEGLLAMEGRDSSSGEGEEYEGEEYYNNNHADHSMYDPTAMHNHESSALYGGGMAGMGLHSHGHGHGGHNGGFGGHSDRHNGHGHGVGISGVVGGHSHAHGADHQQGRGGPGGILKAGPAGKGPKSSKQASAATTPPPPVKQEGFYGFGPFGYGYYGPSGYYNGLAMAPFNPNGDNTDNDSATSGKRRVTFADDDKKNGNDDGSSNVTPPSLPTLILVPPPPPLIPPPPPPLEDDSVATTIEEDPLDKSMWYPTEVEAVAIGIPFDGEDDPYYEPGGQMTEKEFWYPKPLPSEQQQARVLTATVDDEDGNTASPQDGASTTSSSGSSTPGSNTQHSPSKKDKKSKKSKLLSGNRSVASGHTARPSLQDVYAEPMTTTLVDEHGVPKQVPNNFIVVADEHNPLHEKEQQQQLLLMYNASSGGAQHPPLLRRDSVEDNRVVSMDEEIASLDHVDVSPHFMKEQEQLPYYPPQQQYVDPYVQQGGFAPAAAYYQQPLEQQPYDPSLDKSALIDPSLANKSIPVQQQAHLQYWNKSNSHSQSNSQSHSQSGGDQNTGVGAYHVPPVKRDAALVPQRSLSDTEIMIHHAEMMKAGIASDQMPMYGNNDYDAQMPYQQQQQLPSPHYQPQPPLQQYQQQPQYQQQYGAPFQQQPQVSYDPQYDPQHAQQYDPHYVQQQPQYQPQQYQPQPAYQQPPQRTYWL